jgi:hypothetical protein
LFFQAPLRRDTLRVEAVDCILRERKRRCDRKSYEQKDSQNGFHVGCYRTMVASPHRKEAN